MPAVMVRTVLLVLVAGATGLGCSDAGSTTGEASFPVDALTTVTSTHGAFHVDVRTSPDQPPSRGIVSVDYRITDMNQAPADGLTVAVVPWMPDMGHGASTTPTVEKMGGGRYVISNVELFMPGRWDLRTTISGPSQDSVTPEFEIP
jgi:hypothetical protein